MAIEALYSRFLSYLPPLTSSTIKAKNIIVRHMDTFGWYVMKSNIASQKAARNVRLLFGHEL